MCTKLAKCANTKDLSELGMHGEEKDMPVVAVDRTGENARSLTDANRVILWDGYYCDWCSGIRNCLKCKGGNRFCCRCGHIYIWRRQSDLVVQTRSGSNEVAWCRAFPFPPGTTIFPSTTRKKGCVKALLSVGEVLGMACNDTSVAPTMARSSNERSNMDGLDAK